MSHQNLEAAVQSLKTAFEKLDASIEKLRHNYVEGSIAEVRLALGELYLALLTAPNLASTIEDIPPAPDSEVLLVESDLEDDFLAALSVADLTTPNIFKIGTTEEREDALGSLAYDLEQLLYFTRYSLWHIRLEGIHPQDILWVCSFHFWGYWGSSALPRAIAILQTLEVPSGVH